MLQVEGVETYYGEVRALRDVSLSVNEGEIVALLGANGAGKTTLLRTITGLNLVSCGTITFCGNRIENLKPHLINHRGIVLVPEGRQVFPAFSVRENLEVGAYHLRNKQRKRELLELVTGMFPVLAARSSQAAGTLSGGEQQMLAIARAMMSDPKIMLLDEPSLGLAPLIVAQIFRMIRDLRLQGRTILLVEQNAMVALKVADRAYILETGSITLQGPAHDLLQDQAVQRKYLGA